MKKVVLVFSDSISLADFVIRYQIRGADVHSCEHTLTATLSDKELSDAVEEFGAAVHKESNLTHR